MKFWIILQNKKEVFLFCFLLFFSCQGGYFVRYNYENANRLIHETQNLSTKPFLKAHFKNGQVCIFKDTWLFNTHRNEISGQGTLYDFRRKKIKQGPLQFPVDSIVIYETNRNVGDPEGGRATALGILTGLNVALGIFCLMNPKACFGSCPTFYLNKEDNFHYADAEGFTDAIAPGLEYSDIDALNNKTVNRNFELTLRNEAMETHCIRSVKLLAYPRTGKERIFHTPNDEFFLCDKIISNVSATGIEGDITELLTTDDRMERFSMADDNRLNCKEEIFLEFHSGTEVKNPGLVIHFRQTLMTTYLLYTALGYMGDMVSDVFSRIELQPNLRKNWENIKNELGGIKVFLQNKRTGKWEFQGQIFESGPIAINRQMLPFKDSASESDFKIKLILNRGLWRIDYLGLASIKEKVVPFEMIPTEITSSGENKEDALKTLLDKENFLITYPGEEYELSFSFPDENQDYELFLESKGYYLEWMRADWLKYKDLDALKTMVRNPRKFLRKTTKEYKQYEKIMEREFWNSKIEPKTVSNE